MSKTNKDHSVVVYLGDSTVVDPLVHALVDERMGKGNRDLDFEIFRFGERPISEIESALRQVGMFTTERCVWLRGFAESKRRAAQKAAAGSPEDEEDGAEEVEEDGGGTAGLLALLEAGIPAGTLLIVSAESLDARSRLFKWFARHADVQDLRIATDQMARRAKGGEEGLRHAIAGRLAELGVARVDPAALAEIVKRSGSSLGETLQEVDRLVLSLCDPAKLGAADVQTGMRDLAVGWVFDFTSALETRDLGTAEAMIARLLAEGEPPLRIVGLLASHVAKLIDARPAVDTLPRGALRMKGLDFLRGPGASLPDGLRGWPGYFRLRAAANFTSEELRGLHGEVRRLDLALKSSPASPLLLFSRLLQRVCIPGSAS